MKVTTLMENTASGAEFCAAHGLSLYFETPRHRILFDMGPDPRFAENAEKLGIDLAGVDVAVLSHGHYDHAGGLRTFLGRNGRAKVYLHDGAFGQYFAARPDGSMEYIGVDPSLRAFQDRFVMTRGLTKIDGELTLFDEVPDNFDGLTASAKLKEKAADGTYRPDEFHHEQDLLITAEGKTVLVAGCAHRGIVNIRDKAAALLGREPEVVIGGFHLFQLDPEDPESAALIARIGGALREGKAVYYTGHCTGPAAYEKLKATLGGRLHALSGGAAFEL